MATTIEQQVVLDEALIPSAQRLRIGRSNFRLPLDIQSKESTLQVIYDVLRRSPFFKAFLVTTDVLEIYMQEFWATATVHQHSIRFKMDTRKHIVDLEAFREMLHISPRVWEDLVYQVEHKNQKKSNEMYYPRFTKVVIHHFMMKKPSIPKRNKVNWHYVRDDILFSTIKAAPKPKTSARKKKGGSASSTTPPTPIATPSPTTTVVAAPRLSAAAKGKQPARATGPIDPSDVERTKAEQHETHISQQGSSSIDERTGSIPGVSDVPSDDSEEEISWNSFDDEDVLLFPTLS
nr:hypothetical protein [Tanacetum cinerariifolium]